MLRCGLLRRCQSVESRHKVSRSLDYRLRFVDCSPAHVHEELEIVIKRSSFIRLWGGGFLRIFDSLCGHRRECDSCLSAAGACFRSFANDEKIMRASWVKFQSEQERNCRELGSRRIAKNGSRDTGVQFIACPAHSASHERQDVHMTEQVRCVSAWVLPGARCPPVEGTR